MNKRKARVAELPNNLNLKILCVHGAGRHPTGEPQEEKDAKNVPHPTHRLGQAMDLRTSPPTELRRKAAVGGHKGPYLPTLIYACRENELSYEYTHGSIAYGAFTYSLVNMLPRDRRLAEPQLTFTSLISKVRNQLAELSYEQQPKLIAPTDIQKSKIPLRLG